MDSTTTEFYQRRQPYKNQRNTSDLPSLRFGSLHSRLNEMLGLGGCFIPSLCAICGAKDQLTFLLAGPQ